MSLNPFFRTFSTPFGTPSHKPYMGTPITQHTLIVNEPTNGTITGDGIDCPGDCTEIYDEGTVVTLTATPAEGYKFNQWTGDTTDGTVVMDGDKTVGAEFVSLFVEIPFRFTDQSPNPSEFKITYEDGSKKYWIDGVEYASGETASLTPDDGSVDHIIKIDKSSNIPYFRLPKFLIFDGGQLTNLNLTGILIIFKCDSYSGLKPGDGWDLTEIWFYNTDTTFSIDDFSNQVNLTTFSCGGSLNLSGSLSSTSNWTNMTRFQVYNTQITGDLSDVSHFNISKAINVSGTQITGDLTDIKHWRIDDSCGGCSASFNNSKINSCSTNDTLFGPSCLNHNYSNCPLDQTSVDNILIAIDNDGGTNGTLDLTGTSPPSQAGLDAKASLEAKGWTVNVDEAPVTGISVDFTMTADTPDPLEFTIEFDNPDSTFTVDGTVYNSGATVSLSKDDAVHNISFEDTALADLNFRLTYISFDISQFGGCTVRDEVRLDYSNAYGDFTPCSTFNAGYNFNVRGCSELNIETSDFAGWSSTRFFSFNDANITGDLADFAGMSATYLSIDGGSLTCSSPDNLFTAVDDLTAINCGLDSTSVDNILVALDNNGLTDGEADLTGNAPPTQTGLDAKASLEAKGWIVDVNETPMYTLTINTPTNGRITGPGGIDCPGTCTATFEDGTNVTLEAIADDGYMFDSWTGDTTDGTLVMDGDKTVGASFVELVGFTLTVNEPTNGTITGDGIDCPGDCSHDYPTDTVVELTAVPADGYRLANWTGDTTDGTVTMDSDKTVGAVFEPIVYHTITVNQPANGRIVSEDGRITDDTNNVQDYEEGKTVYFHPVPADGYYFAGWSGDIGADGDVIVDGDKTLSCTFEPVSYSTTVPIGVAHPAKYWGGIDPLAAQPPAEPDPWDTDVPGWYYVDNTHPDASDAGNGNRTVPRLTIPTNLSAGDVVIIAGGPYTNLLVFNSLPGTVDNPIWIVGEGDPIIQIGATADDYDPDVEIFNASYVFIRGLTFVGTSRPSTKYGGVIYINEDSHHVVIDNITIRDYPEPDDCWGRAAIAFQFSSSWVRPQVCQYMLVNNVSITNYQCSWPPTCENGSQGVVMIDGVDHIWVLNSYFYHEAEDGIHIIGLHGRHDVTEKRGPHRGLPYYIWVAGNTFNELGENAVDVKESKHVIISSNQMSYFRDTEYWGWPAGVGGGGQAIVCNDEGNQNEGGDESSDTCWVIFNRIDDCQYLMVNQSGNPTYILGNIVTNIIVPEYGSSSSIFISKVKSYADEDAGIDNGDVWIADNTIDIFYEGVYINNTARHYSYNNLILGKNADNSNYHYRVNNARISSENIGDYFYDASYPLNISVVNCTDCDNTNTDPVIDADYKPLTGSPLIGRSSNICPAYDLFETLYGENIKYDINGKARPAGNWTTGAIEPDGSE